MRWQSHHNGTDRRLASQPVCTVGWAAGSSLYQLLSTVPTDRISHIGTHTRHRAHSCNVDHHGLTMLRISPVQSGNLKARLERNALVHMAAPQIALFFQGPNRTSKKSDALQFSWLTTSRRSYLLGTRSGLHRASTAGCGLALTSKSDSRSRGNPDREFVVSKR